MGEAADHLAHGGEAFGLDNLLFQFFLHGYVAHGDDDAGGLAFGIEHGTGSAKHRVPAAVAMLGCIFARGQLALGARDGVVEIGQFRRSMFDLIYVLPKQVFGAISKELGDTGADEGVFPFQVENQDQVGETFEQVALEFFLAA